MKNIFASNRLILGGVMGLVLTFAFLGTVMANPHADQPEQRWAHLPEGMESTMGPPAELSMGSFLPKGFIETHFIEQLPEVLADRYPGQIKIVYKGGPETFPSQELFSYVQKNAVNMANVPTSYYASEIPVAQALNLVTMPTWEWHKTGVNDWAERIHKKHGIKYLGQTEGGISYHCYTKQKVEKPEDLKGLTLRASPNYQPLLEHFGVNAVVLPPPEIYTSLDRGVVDGFCWPGAGMVVSQEWHKKVNYVIDPGFYQVELALIMNLDAWNNLSQSQQVALMDAVHLLERQTYHYFGEKAVLDRKKMIQDGLKVAEFTGDARKRWIKASFTEFWKMLVDQAGREDVEALNRILQEAGQETYFPENYNP